MFDVDFWAYLYMKNYIRIRPLDINVETVSFCPMKCVFCCNRLYKRDYIVMNIGLFEKIVREYVAIGGGTIGIGSMQSDFLSDPLLMERIKVLKKYKNKLWIHSTTPLISCKKYSDKQLIEILKAFSCLEISVEGYDRDSYKMMAGVDAFDIFKEQLYRVKRLIDSKSLSINIKLLFRTADKNELKKSEFYKEIRKMFPVKEIRTSFFDWFGSIKKEDLPVGTQLIKYKNVGKRVDCIVPCATLAIQASGKVVGCGCIDWLEQYVIGDCTKNSLRRIWHSSKARNFRYAFSKGKVPTICKECGLYTSSEESLKNRKFLGYTSQRGLYYLL